MQTRKMIKARKSSVPKAPAEREAQKSACDLPFEMVTIILLFLPPKFLMKFMCVSKAWRDLIRDPLFVDQYRKIWASKNEGFILYKTMDDEANKSFNLLLYRPFQEEDSRLRMGFLNEWDSKNIVASSNGVLCLTETKPYGSTIYLCNLSIRKYRIICSSTFDLKLVENKALGFGYNAETNDYKVIRIAHASPKNAGNSNNHHNTKVEVYSVNLNSWKEIDVASYFPWSDFDDYSAVLFNESLHWVAIDQSIGEETILSFDLKEEAFKVMNLPNYNEEIDLLEVLGVYKGALALFVYCPLIWDPRAEQCDLWVMQEYGIADSWTKLHTISLEGRVDWPLSFTNHGEIILLDRAKRVHVHNFDTRHTTYLGIVSSDCTFVAYTNSLGLIDEMNVLPHQEESGSSASNEDNQTPAKHEGASTAYPPPSFPQ